jgi:nucleotide-binding universal stress UspA family protein
MKILCPVDQSKRDGISLPYCMRMGRDYGARITVVHAISLTRSLLPGSTREADAYIYAVKEGFAEQGIAIEGAVHKGDPATVIAVTAEEYDVDLIVMASRSRSNFGKLVLGSVADTVLRESRKPILLLSEAANGVHTDETLARQSAYLGTVVWNKRASGLYSEEEAEQMLEQLAAQGLDRAALFGTYQTLRQNGAPFQWLDIDFQVETLRRFLPEEVPGLAALADTRPPDSKAA